MGHSVHHFIFAFSINTYSFVICRVKTVAFLGYKHLLRMGEERDLGYTCIYIIIV